MVSDGIWTYAWEHGRQLSSMSDNDSTVPFAYDAEGKRISKSDGTNTFEYFYADGKLTRIKRNNTTLHFDYDMLGPSVIRYNGVDYYYHRNAQGDIDGISNAAGELVASYRYDAWGKPISVTGTMASTIGVLNPFRYRGYVYDEETGLYYLNTRYYDPEIGRFISPDSVSYLGADGTILGYDLYTYCDNDPVNKKDPLGTDWEDVFDAIESIIVVGAEIACIGLFLMSVAGTGGGSLLLAGAGGAGLAAAGTASTLYAIGEGLSIIGTGLALDATIMYMSKKSKPTKKERSTEHPDWVYKEDIDMSQKPQTNAKRLLDEKYGKGKWKKGPRTEFNRIVKWITRDLQ